jgi:hypothetical protein
MTFTGNLLQILNCMRQVVPPHRQGGQAREQKIPGGQAEVSNPVPVSIQDLICMTGDELAKPERNVEVLNETVDLKRYFDCMGDP